MPAGRPFCSDVSLENDEPLAATASRVDHWILVEYRGLWSRDALAGSGLSDQVKQRLREQAAARPHTKLLFIRRTERRGRPELAVLWGSSSERGGALFRTAIESYEDVLALDVTVPGEPLEHPLLLVCTHGKHDPCCARHGRPLYQALAELAEDDWVWQVSHVGGDRFAGNLVVLPDGLYFGRVTPAAAWPVLDEYLAGRIQLEHYRGRTAYGFATQAAERAVRQSAGLVGLADLELEQERPIVAFRGGGRRFEVDVTAAPGPLSSLTCSSEGLRHPRRYAARILRESAV
ncbi:MAG TPA: sucrase ferredoxin [Gaiellaceae bacterium]|nr:sucrase ferredoxin [Gaiellaceae bacterium]